MTSGIFLVAEAIFSDYKKVTKTIFHPVFGGKMANFFNFFTHSSDLGECWKPDCSLS